MSLYRIRYHDEPGEPIHGWWVEAPGGESAVGPYATRAEASAALAECERSGTDPVSETVRSWR